MMFDHFSTLNDSLLEKAHKVDASLQEVNDSYLESTNHVNADTEQVHKHLLMAQSINIASKMSCLTSKHVVKCSF